MIKQRQGHSAAPQSKHPFLMMGPSSTGRTPLAFTAANAWIAVFIWCQPVSAQCAPYLRVVDDCVAVDEQGATYFELKRGVPTTYHGRDSNRYVVNPADDWETYRRDPDQFDPRGFLDAKWVVGAPESLELVRARIEAHPNEPWFHYCEAQGLRGTVNSRLRELRTVRQVGLAELLERARQIDEALITLQAARAALVRTGEVAGIDATTPRRYSKHNEIDLEGIYIDLPNEDRAFLGTIRTLVDARIGVSLLIDVCRPGDPARMTKTIEAYVDWIAEDPGRIHRHPLAVETVRNSEKRFDRADQNNRQPWRDVLKQSIRLEKEILEKTTSDDLRRYISIYDRFIEDLQHCDFYLERARLYLELAEFDLARSDLDRYLEKHGHRSTFEQETARLNEAIQKRTRQTDTPDPNDRN